MRRLAFALLWIVSDQAQAVMLEGHTHSKTKNHGEAKSDTENESDSKTMPDPYL